MRIIQILNTLNWSAASDYCVGVSAELIRLGHEVLIITQPGYALDHIKQMGLPYDDSINFSLKSPLSYVAAVKRFKRIYKDFKPDIVIGVGGYVTFPVIYAAKKEGYNSILAFVIQMEGIEEVLPNVEMQPEFGTAIEDAKCAGVDIIFIKCRVFEDRVFALEE